MDTCSECGTDVEELIFVFCCGLFLCDACKFKHDERYGEHDEWTE